VFINLFFISPPAVSLWKKFDQQKNPSRSGGKDLNNNIKA